MEASDVIEEAAACAGPDLKIADAETPAKRALIVDDEPHVRSLIARWLADEGFQCRQAEDARAACDHLRGGEVDLITLDITLPGRSGIDLLEEIFAISPDAVVLMVTATQEARTAIEVLRRGASGYLVKPVSREQLLLQVRKALAQRQMLIERRRYTEQLERQLREQTGRHPPCPRRDDPPPGDRQQLPRRGEQRAHLPHGIDVPRSWPARGLVRRRAPT